MAEVTVTISPQHMAEILKYAERQNSNIYAEIVRNSNFSPSPKDLAEQVDAYCENKHRMTFETDSWDAIKDPAVLKERVKVLADRFAATQSDQAVSVFSKIAALTPALKMKSGRMRLRLIVSSVSEPH
jgi:hypothetical protein